MNKKILSLVLALVMVLGTFANVFATETKKADDAKKVDETKKVEETKEAKDGEKVEKVVGKDNKIQYIIDKKFVEGYEDGSYGYDKNITRAEITRLLVLANGNKELAEKLQGSMKIYTDVDTKHWANGVITVGTTKPADANGIAMLAGYPDKSFKPESNVTYAELSKMLVVLVKKDLTADMVKNAVWASSWMTWAAELGILDDVTVADSNAAATRADAFTMLYNALYKMETFKRKPANAKVGVLSSLNRNGKLVLNQDSKEEYTITDETVFVNIDNNKTSNVIKVKNMTNPDYYLGSLVRIITNDKKEVTHILELGNPEKMALGLNDREVGKNTRWEGVSEYTVSTKYDKYYTTLKDENTSTLDSYVKIKLNKDGTKASNITFYNVKNADKKNDDHKDVTLKLNNKTKYYVANPANNIMREVKDVNEALSLIGIRDVENVKIPNVYAGFESDGTKSAIVGFDDADRNTANVVVFNVVRKSEGGDLYRIVNQASSLGNATLEDTDGKIMDKDFLKDSNAYPYNYGDKWDVIELKGRNKAVEKRIDHSDTKEYPVVEVVSVSNNGYSIEVKDANRYTTVLDARDASIFNAKQFKDLKAGDKLQFENEKMSRVVDIISILPRDTEVKGSIRDLVNSIDTRTKVGKLIEVNKDTIVVDVYNNNFDQEAGKKHETFYVSERNAEALKGYMDKEIVFEVRDDMGGDYGKAYAYNFTLNDKDKTPIVKVEDKVNELKAILNRADKFGEINNEKIQAAKDLMADFDAKVKALTTLEKPEWEAYYTGNVEKVITDFKAKIKAYEDAKTAVDEAAAKVMDNMNVTVTKGKLEDLTTVNSAIKNAVTTAINDNDITSKVEDLENTKDNNSYMLKVTVSKDGYSVEKNVTFIVAEQN